MNENLTQRKFNILLATIDNYIKTAQPIGSRVLSKNYNIGFSPATIRNEMSDLGDLGYLVQSHISSGRIPSQKAFRLYVDYILDKLYKTDDSSSSLMSIRKPYERIVEPEKLIKINFLLKKLFLGKNLNEVYDNLDEFSSKYKYNDLFKGAITDIIENEKDKLSSMYVSVEGLSNIFKYSEYSDLDKVKSIIEYLENKDKIVNILNSSDNFLDIKVGNENNEQSLVENTIIKSSYFFNKNNIGVIAIVAPMRMNYELSIEAMFKLSRRINGLIIRGDYYER
ncbi:MAG: heat-inducible transcription repressor HrcA [Finegoldia magna]|nr:heat-inducible transcription repressor HrcA [Finegoldia magna]